jgi:DNA-binding NtrC family response regulator
MGPKGYRICWMGKDLQRMQSVFSTERDANGEYFFLPYPVEDRARLLEIQPSLFLIDTKDLDGYRRDLFRWISICRELSPRGKILLLDQEGFSNHFSDALRFGADWIIPFFEDVLSLRIMILNMVLLHKKEREILHSPVPMNAQHLFEGMIGKTEIMQDLFRLIQKCAPSRTNVLIRGESGTGKELVARALHRRSSRKGNLIVVNCASLMDTLHQSELFGHEKGSFTDAKTRRIGYFEAAREGTLFLDEIGDISAQTQVALLRVIEGMEFSRVGGCDPIRVDVRVLSATNRNLEEKVKQGQFREDLYYRLNGFSLSVPPLRDRKEDVPILATAFLRRYADREEKPVRGFSAEALDLLSTYRWPGNIRELENEVQRIMIHLDREPIISSHMLIPPINVLKNLPASPSTGSSQLKIRMQQAEAFFIKEALKRSYGNRTRTAEHLGISREGLHKKMSRYHIR